MTSEQEVFTQEIKKATQVSGVFFWNDFLSPEECDLHFSTLNDDNKMPWNLNPRLGFEKLRQHAYQFNRTSKETSDSEGLALIDGLCDMIENRFDCKVSDVFCNRFQDPSHMIDWHRDTYGTHIFVLSLGSQRKVQFRPNRSTEVTTFCPRAGEMYFMPLQLNKTHKHKVCAAESGDDTSMPRISLVFFASTPKYAKEFKVSQMDKVIGAFYSVVS